MLRVRTDPKGGSPQGADRLPDKTVVDEGEARKYVLARIDDAEHDRVRTEAVEEALTATEHFDGTKNKQWGAWNAVAGGLVYPGAPAWRIHRTINLTQGTALTINAKVGLRRPRFVFAVNEEKASADYDSSALERWHSWLYEDQGVDALRWKTCAHLTVCGNAFWKVWFDPTIGTTIEDPDGGPAESTGRVVYELRRMTEILVDPTVDDLYKPDGRPLAAWIAERTYVSREEAIMEYEDAQEVLSSPDGDTEDDETDGADDDDEIVGAARKRRRPIRKIEFYHAPTPKHPAGWTVTMLNARVLPSTVGELPYFRATRGKVTFPYIHFKTHIYVPGKFYRAGPTWVLRGMQKALNRRMSSGEEYELTMAYGRTLYDRGSIQNPENLIVSENNGLYEIEPGMRDPRFSEPKPLGGEWWQGNSAIYGFMKEESLVRDVSRGTASPNAKTAAGQYLLKEADDSVLGGFAFEIERAEERALRMAMMLEAAFGTDEELRAVMSPDGVMDEFVFRRAALEDAPGVMIETGSLFPRDRMLQQAAMIQMVEMGIIDREEARRALNMRLTSDDPKSLAAYQRARAQRENRAMLRGEFPDVRDFDDDEIHLYEVELLQNSLQYERQPLGVQDIIDAHALMHRRRIEEKKMAALALAAPPSPQGGAGPAGARGTPRSASQEPPSRAPQSEGRDPALTSLGIQNSMMAAGPRHAARVASGGASALPGMGM